MQKVCLHLFAGVFLVILGGFYFTSSSHNKMSCVFCDIINKKTDTEILYEVFIDFFLNI